MAYKSLSARGLMNAVFAPLDALGSSTVQGGNGVAGGDIIEKIANGIAWVETRGAADAYTKPGKVITNPNSMYYGDRAWGKYQVMGKNIPSWTKEAFGKAMTVQEFINNPQAQDALARKRFAAAYQKYGTPEDVASVWFTGGPLKRSGGAVSDGQSTNAEYIQVFREGMNRGGHTASAARPAAAVSRPGAAYVPLASRGA